jgi:hypothetical protein
MDLDEPVFRHWILGGVDILEELWRGDFARVKERVAGYEALELVFDLSWQVLNISIEV